MSQKTMVKDLSNPVPTVSGLPMPVMQAGRDGRLFYANRASQPILKKWGCKVDELLPAVWKKRVAAVLRTGKQQIAEEAFGKRLFSLQILPDRGGKSVSLVGQEITTHRKTEEQLRTLAIHQEAILAAAPEIIMEVNEKKVYTWANPAGVAFFGRDVIGKEAAHYFEGDQDTYAIVQPLFNGNEDTIYLESWQRRQDGQKRLLAWWCHTIMDKDGKVLGALSTARDITEQRKAERELRQRSDDLTLLNSINNAVNRGESLDFITQLISRETNRIFDTNGTTLHLVDPFHQSLVMKNLSLPPTLVKKIEKVIGASIPRIEHHLNSDHPYRKIMESGESTIINDLKDIAKFTAGFLQATHLSAKTQSRLERLIPFIIKILRYRSLLIVPLLTGNQVIGTLDMGRGEPFTVEDAKRLETIAMQFTAAIQRKQSEKELQESEERLRTIVEGTQALLVSVDIEGHFTYVNDATVRAVGLRSPEELLGKPYLHFVHPEDRQRILTSFLDQAKTMQPSQTEEFRIIDIEGNEKWFRFLSNLTIRDGDVLGQSGVAQDITAEKQADQALRESHDQILLVLDSIPADIYVADLNTFEILFVNRHMRDSFGKDLVGKVCWKVFRDSPGPCPHCSNPGLIDSQGNPTQGVTWEGKNPVTGLWYTNHDRAIRWVNGKLVRLEVSVDITESKLAEEARFEALSRFSGFAEASQYGMGIADLNGMIIYVNPTLTQMLDEKTPEDCLGKHFPTTYYPPQVSQTIEETVIPALKREGHWHGELELLSVKGRHIPTDENFFIIKDKEGNPRYIADLLTDITERKLVEQARSAAEAKYRILVEQIPAITYIDDPEKTGISIFVSPQIETILGISQADWMHYDIDDWGELTHPEDRDRVLTAYRKTMETGQPFNEEYRVIRPDGRMVWIDDHAVTLKDDGTQLSSLHGVMFDITERKLAEKVREEYSSRLEMEVEERTRDLRQAQEKLIRQEKLATLGQLAGGVGHELRNPLAVINNAVYYLKMIRKEPQGKVLEYLTMIEKETQNAEKIITDLLEFSRTKSVNREPVSAVDLVRQVMLRYPSPEKVRVKQQFASDLPWMLADQRQMEQVLGNLVVNAYQAMPEGGTLSIFAKHVGDKLALVVKDTGTGIPPENMDMIFEPLFTTKAKGVGLGLAVSRKLVEANEGRITVESTPGKGTSFTVLLPVHVVKHE